MNKISFSACRFFVISMLGILLWSCFGTVYCPVFDENILLWLPYENGDVINLKKQDSDSLITLNVDDLTVTHVQKYDNGYDCGGCDDQIQINNHSSSNFNVSYHLYKNEITYESYLIVNTKFNASEFYNEYDFSGEKYENVKVLKSNGHFTTAIIVKNIGLVGLINENGEEWTLITDDKKRSKATTKKNIVINNKIGC